MACATQIVNFEREFCRKCIMPCKNRDTFSAGKLNTIRPCISTGGQAHQLFASEQGIANTCIGKELQRLGIHCHFWQPDPIGFAPKMTFESRDTPNDLVTLTALA